MNSGYKVIYSSEVRRQFKKMDKQLVQRILTWVEHRLVGCQNPRLWGAALSGELSEFWKYRIGDFRLICKIKDNELTVYIVELGHRKNIYN